jgi:hypothetical protein
MFNRMPLPLLTTLAFSGGRMSSAILWMVIRGDIHVDKSKFVAIFADTGFENPETYKNVERMFSRARQAGIRCEWVAGSSLYDDIMEHDFESNPSFPLPPYWVDKGGGEKGKITHACTYHYKVAPSRRVLRRILGEMYRIRPDNLRLPEGAVHTWIGFSFDEFMRIKPEREKYIKNVYPLIQMKMDTVDVMEFYEKNSLPVPPKSACEGCFAKPVLGHFQTWKHRPEQWRRAKNVDRKIRTALKANIDKPLYMSPALVSLDNMESVFSAWVQMNGEREPGRKEIVEFMREALFSSDEPESIVDDESCDSGYCFT